MFSPGIAVDGDVIVVEIPEGVLAIVEQPGTDIALALEPEGQFVTYAVFDTGSL